MCRQAGAVTEQMAERDVCFAVHTEVVEEAGHPIVEGEPPIAHEQQHGGRRGQALGQRREIEDDVEPHRRRLRYQRAGADGALEDGIALAADEEDRSRIRAPSDSLLERVLDGTEAHPSTTESTPESRP